MTPLPFDAPLASYAAQADALLAAHRAADPDAIRIFHEKHPRFLDDKVKWLPKRLEDGEIAAAALTADDARLALARWYDFLDWDALSAYVDAVHHDENVRRFEMAVEAVVDGDLETLQSLLSADPELVRARSTRVTHFDPPVHRAALLHYIGANGVEGNRQRTPANAVAITRALLDAGADVDSLADLYGGKCTTMSLLVSSCHPANAGLQAELAGVLVEYGASLTPRGEGTWTSPVRTALTFGYIDTAETLVKLGAAVESLSIAAGLGRIAEFERLLPDADAAERHRALALAAQLGQVETTRRLLDVGEDPNRLNPEGFHSHGTPLHQAVWGERDAVVRLLVERGARLDIRDTLWQGTPLDWAEYGKKTAIAAYLRSVTPPGATPSA